MQAFWMKRTKKKNKFNNYFSTTKGEKSRLNLANARYELLTHPKKNGTGLEVKIRKIYRWQRNVFNVPCLYKTEKYNKKRRTEKTK